MRVTNIKAGSLVTPLRPRFDSDKYPCYYAETEKAEKRKDWKWKLGCKYFGFATDTEYSFKMAKVGDVDDDGTWNYITSTEFAAEIIDIYREGGDPAIKEWIKNGCP